jgi:hypothetical protein
MAKHQTHQSVNIDACVTSRYHILYMIQRCNLLAVSLVVAIHLISGQFQIPQNNTRAVCKVRGFTLLLLVGTLWRCDDGLFIEVPPWQAMHFLQRSTHFSKTCCRPLITSKFLTSELSFLLIIILSLPLLPFRVLGGLPRHSKAPISS